MANKEDELRNDSAQSLCKAWLEMLDEGSFGMFPGFVASDDSDFPDEGI